MKLRIKRIELDGALSTLAGALSAKSTLPVLGNVLVETQGNAALRLTATDLDMTISEDCPAEIIQEGQTTLPAKRFSQMVKSFDGEWIEIEVAGDAATMEQGSAKFKLLGLPATDFPNIDPGQFGPDHIQMPAKDLLRIIKRTAFAASNDESRYVLNGLYFEVRDKQLSVIGTDGRRCAVQTQQVEIDDLDAIIPNKAVAFMARNLAGVATVNLEFTDHSVKVTTGQWEMTSKLIEGNFPNWRQVMPAECKTILTVNRDAALSAINRVSLMSHSAAPSVKIELSENLMRLSSADPNAGEASEEVACEWSHGEVVAAFNNQFLADGFKCLDSETVTIAIDRAETPAEIVTQDGFRYVIMPMRTA